MKSLAEMRSLALVPRAWVRDVRRALLAGLVLGLVACGGGGGDSGPQPTQVQGPPSTPATLSSSGTEATEAVKAALATSDATVARSSSLSGLGLLLGGPIGMGPDGVAGLKQPLAVETASCSDFFAGPCTGSVTLDTNVADNARFVPAGSFVDVRFNTVSGPMSGQSVTLSGRFRLEFVTGFDLSLTDATNFTGLDVIVTSDQLGGTINGYAFGPINDVGELKISAQGVTTMVADGRSFTGLGSVTVTDAANYRIGSGTVRIPYWGVSGGYVDVGYSNWQMVNGQPVDGSTVTISSGAGSSISIRATFNTAPNIDYVVALTAGGVTLRFRVTATYPAGGGAPTYAPPVPLP